MNLPRSTEDLQNLITNGVQESLHLDYKRSGALSQRNFKEVSKDVSAFANADGGMIVYGIEEDKHIPTRIDTGVDHSMMSRERLEQTVTSNVAPKLPGLEIVQIPLSGTHSAFAISIPKSYRGPHQDRATHKYYKRHNFSAEPMEDYEIADLRARAQTVPPLINLRPDVRPNNLFFLVIENLGSLPAQDVTFDFSPGLKWRKDTEQPQILRDGIKYLGPGSRFDLFYGVSFEILGNESEMVKEFDAIVSYVHPTTGERISESFHINFIDYLNTWPTRSDVADQGKNLENALMKIVENLQQINKNLAALTRLAGPTGLDLSIRSLRNLRALHDTDLHFQKLNPVTSDVSVFHEVLQIDFQLASRLAHHFWQSNCMKGISSIDGVDDEMVAAIRKYFDVSDDDV